METSWKRQKPYFCEDRFFTVAHFETGFKPNAKWSLLIHVTIKKYILFSMVSEGADLKVEKNLKSFLLS